MKGRQLRVGQCVEHALIVGPRILQIIGNRAEFALRVEDAQKRTGRADVFSVTDMVDGRLRNCLQRAMLCSGILPLELVKTSDLFVLDLVRAPQVCELRLRLKQDHRGHIGTVDGVEEVSITVQSIAQA